MKRILVGFDDTDMPGCGRGTGKLARWFKSALPEGCRVAGVVRQQLWLDDTIPYTSHNSSACVMVDTPDMSYMDGIVARAVGHLRDHYIPGSDPGLCVAPHHRGSLADLVSFGQACTCRKVTQDAARKSVNGFHLSGHGGTRDGIIGAAAAVGLTAAGCSGRFIEYGELRKLPQTMDVWALHQLGIQVVSVDRDARLPVPEDLVHTRNWVRPWLVAHQPVLLVRPKGDSLWECIYGKRSKTPACEGKISGD
jgi:tRNA(Ile2) C34 agmatinyltransferase TiaS